MTLVTEYFKNKADRYDDVDMQPYWVFSDEILWHLLCEKALPKDKESSFTLFDAGAGTARWSEKVLKTFPNAEATLVDLSDDMLSVAKEKMATRGFSDRAKIFQGDITNDSSLPNDKFDFIFCFHNVIGFCGDTKTAMKNLFSKLKTGGTLAVMFPSYYHALYFSNVNGRAGQYTAIMKDKEIQYNDQMPPLEIFEKEDIEKFALDNESKEITYGFPLTLYPGMEETFIEGTTKKLDTLLGNASTRQRLLEEEKRLCLNENLFARGNNLLTLFRN